ncbi:hypothetical protein CspeluHIS016_0502290 [Cutaneotrichosporon spelunceum]|uniref:Mannosyltransferase n=1 Tax=Cutaneotrichosporon spelunceum TaxID=1672016 RepID=A0AAD3TXF5_9TREE|nr:hypothetical protein CspeluHIS016_0502290 [Cutaneotrichosporon spelunceum]
MLVFWAYLHLETTVRCWVTQGAAATATLTAKTLLGGLAILGLSTALDWAVVGRLTVPALTFFYQNIVLNIASFYALQAHYAPAQLGLSSIPTSIRQYCRIPTRPFYFVLLSPIIPYLYLNGLHGAAQVSVMNGLRHGDFGPVTSVVALMPCHSTPWSSHLGNIPGWFLTCAPPLGQPNTAEHQTQQKVFYESPVTYIQHVFPQPPLKVGRVSASGASDDEHLPSHILLFGELLRRRDTLHNSSLSVEQALAQRGYHETANLWNGFDFAQDEELRQGGVRVWVQD